MSVNIGIIFRIAGLGMLFLYALLRVFSMLIPIIVLNAKLDVATSWKFLCILFMLDVYVF